MLLTACGDDTTGAGGAAGTGGAGGAASTTAQGSPTTSTTGEGGGPATTAGQGGSGDGGSSAVGTTGQGGSGTGGATGAGGGFACTVEPFAAASEDAFQLPGDALGYLAIASAVAPSDDLAIELYSDFGATGPRTILEEDYATCNPCVLLRRDCDENLDNCAQRFLATEGTIAVDTFDTTFAGTLEGVVLVEVTLDADLHATPVPGGEVLCIDAYDFEAPIQTGG